MNYIILLRLPIAGTFSISHKTFLNYFFSFNTFAPVSTLVVPKCICTTCQNSKQISAQCELKYTPKIRLKDVTLVANHAIWTVPSQNRHEPSSCLFKRYRIVYVLQSVGTNVRNYATYNTILKLRITNKEGSIHACL